MSPANASAQVQVVASTAWSSQSNTSYLIIWVMERFKAVRTDHANKSAYIELLLDVHVSNANSLQPQLSLSDLAERFKKRLET